MRWVHMRCFEEQVNEGDNSSKSGFSTSCQGLSQEKKSSKGSELYPLFKYCRCTMCVAWCSGTSDAILEGINGWQLKLKRKMHGWALTKLQEESNVKAEDN